MSLPAPSLSPLHLDAELTVHRPLDAANKTLFAHPEWWLKQDNGSGRVRAILLWLRKNRIATGTRLPWILCGSIGLDSFVAKHGLEGSINELLSQPVEAFQMEQAIELLVRLGRTPSHDCPVSDEVAGYMVERVGWPVPFYLQLLFHGLKSLAPSSRSVSFPDRADVDAAYDSLLVPLHRGHFGHWDSRLGDLLEPDEQSNAHLLLGQLSQHPAGQSRRQLRNRLAKQHPQADPAKLDRQLADLLDFLERDGYLGRQGDTFAFRSFLLRDYWHRRFGS